MATKNDDVIQPAITGTANGLAEHIGPLYHTGEPITLRAGLDVLSIAQDFTFYRTETKDGEDVEVETERTITFVPKGVAKVMVSGVVDKFVEYVYWETDGMQIPNVYLGGVVRESKFWGKPLGDEKNGIKRPFFDLPLGNTTNEKGEKQPAKKLGGLYDTMTTTLMTTGLSGYFLTTDEEPPGESRKDDGIPFGSLIKEARAAVANMRKMGVAITPEQEEAVVEARIAERKAEIEANNAKKKGPAVDPDTLTMETKTA